MTFGRCLVCDSDNFCLEVIHNNAHLPSADSFSFIPAKPIFLNMPFFLEGAKSDILCWRLSSENVLTRFVTFYSAVVWRLINLKLCLGEKPRLMRCRSLGPALWTHNIQNSGHLTGVGGVEKPMVSIYDVNRTLKILNPLLL